MPFNREDPEKGRYEMNDNGRKIGGTLAGAIAITALIGFAAASCNEKKDSSQKNSETSVVTNENGSISRSFTETTVSTNGGMVTEHRRETRTTLDSDGNLLATTTSEYAQSYPAGDETMRSLATPVGGAKEAKDASGAEASGSFLGLSFGEAFKGTNFVDDADEPSLKRATFKPGKGLAGFDDYYVYVTPKTHRIAKIYACAKEAVDPGVPWRSNYLIEALEKRYRTWARPRSWCRPVYTFDIGAGRYVTACLAGATRDYETVLVAWDDALIREAGDEAESIREEARRSAAEKRRARVSDAAAAF